MKPVMPFVLISVLFALTGCDAEQGSHADSPAQVAEAPAGNHKRVVADISLTLKRAQMDWVGQKIFANECASRFDCLVHWNEGEAFPSLGIGHFIWYPEGVEGRFTESFPQLIRYMIQRQARVPDWLRNLEPFDAPWPDRNAFLAVEDSVRIAELREFLAGTQGLQAEFIFRRAGESLGKVVEAAPADRRDQIRSHHEALSVTPGGVYALMDYVNFKGEGLSESERYNGEGWGLLQVLLEMELEGEATELQAFREAAGRVLTRRAENAGQPIERERWLTGWLKRLETYQEPAGGPES